METEQTYGMYKSHHQHRSSGLGRILAGLIVLTAGVLLLARAVGADLPWWLFTWQTLLIVIGLFIGVRHSFRGWAWFILIALGVFFFIDDFIGDLEIKKFIWPSIIILVGLFMIFRTRRSKHHRHNATTGNTMPDVTLDYNDDYLDSTTLFGGVKKNIVSKDFKGGEAVTIFGGTELNLLNAGLTTTRTLELTQIFGGTKLVVPAGWHVITDEVVAILGGIDDKRTIHTITTDEAAQTLRLKGTCIFGGISIESY